MDAAFLEAPSGGASLAEGPRLDWSRRDPEQRLFFPGAKFTRVGAACSGLIAAALTVAFYGALSLWPDSQFARSLTRSVVSYPIVLLTFWSLAVLTLKVLKLRLQREALSVRVTPEDPTYALSPETVDEVRTRLFEVSDDPRNFVLLNRIQVALQNLRNLGRVGDVGEMLQTQAAGDEASSETSYALVQGFVWAIPVLGFIGTVLGLSAAIGNFGAVLDGGGEMTAVKEALRDVAGGLSVAFETTLQGLVASLVVQLLITTVKKSEEEFFDACSEYCLRQIVGRLRLSPSTARPQPAAAKPAQPVAAQPVAAGAGR